MDNALVDASFLIALAYPRDSFHAIAKQFIAKSPVSLQIPEVVLPEVMYNLRRVGRQLAVIRYAEQLALAQPFIYLHV